MARTRSAGVLAMSRRSLGAMLAAGLLFSGLTPAPVAAGDNPYPILELVSDSGTVHPGGLSRTGRYAVFVTSDTPGFDPNSVDNRGWQRLQPRDQ